MMYVVKEMGSYRSKLVIEEEPARAAESAVKFGLTSPVQVFEIGECVLACVSVAADSANK